MKTKKHLVFNPDTRQFLQSVNLMDKATEWTVFTKLAQRFTEREAEYWARLLNCKVWTLYFGDA